MKTIEGASARERLLAAADEFFCNEGIHTVGIDRVIEQAGVFAEPGFRGCAFISASSESPRPGGPVETATREYRGWFRGRPRPYRARHRTNGGYNARRRRAGLNT